MVAKVTKTEERIHGKRAAARRAAKGRIKVARRKEELVGRVESRTHSSVVSERRQQ